MDPLKIGSQYIVNGLCQSLVNKSCKKGNVIFAVFLNNACEGFQHLLCYIHVPDKITKRHLRFNHPEFRHMP